MGDTESKETAKAKAERKIWIPVSTDTTMLCQLLLVFFSFSF